MLPDRDCIRDTLRMTDSALRALLVDLDRQDAKGSVLPPALRQRPEGRIVIEVIRHNEGVARYLAAARHMTPGGILVVHGVFLHTGNCVVHMTTVDGEKTAVGGRVTRCRYVGTRMHESQIDFDAPVDLSHYLERPALLGRQSIAA